MNFVLLCLLLLFFLSPSHQLLNSYSKEQLLKLVEHYDTDVIEKRQVNEGCFKGKLWGFLHCRVAVAEFVN